jgi:hypothetical protein
VWSHSRECVSKELSREERVCARPFNLRVGLNILHYRNLHFRYGMEVDNFIPADFVLLYRTMPYPQVMGTDIDIKVIREGKVGSWCGRGPLADTRSWIVAGPYIFLD